ncbi:MAG: GGDEF domain-containing protein [Solirubrobacteraceae bacterium]
MGRLELKRGVIAVWALNAALAAGALALYLHVGAFPAPGAHVRMPWWLLAAAFALTETAVVHVHFRRSAHTLTLAELPLALGLLFAAPGDVVIGWIAGAGLVLMLNRNLPRIRLIFNLGQLGVTAGVAVALFHAVSGPVADNGPRLWAAAAASLLLASVVSVSLVSAAMWLSGDSIPRRMFADMVAMATSVAAINASLGLAASTVLATDPRGAVLLLGPAIAVFVAYRAYTSERRQHTNIEFLHAASHTLSHAPDTVAGLAGVLAMALESFRAEVADVSLFPVTDDVAGRRIAVGTADRLEVMQPLDDRVASALAALVVADPAARLITPASVGGALAGHLDRLGVAEAMLAPLPGERRVIGAVMIANRLGTGAGGFARADLKLFETLSRQTGAELGQDRLGRKVSELKELHVELEHRAFHDPLTGLPNRLLFMNRVDYVLKRRTGNAAVIYIDLDNFKPINDTHGHEAGDAVLKAAGERLLASLRPSDTAARLGGDEFAVLLVDIPEEHISVVADRIVGNLTQPLEFDGRELLVGASLGVASAASGTLDADSLVRNADVAMYVAKHGGKGCLSVFEPEVVAG